MGNVTNDNKNEDILATSSRQNLIRQISTQPMKKLLFSDPTQPMTSNQN